LYPIRSDDDDGSARDLRHVRLGGRPGGCVRTQRRTLAPPLEWSKAFMLAMGVVLFTAGFMWQPKGHIFLLALSLVSAYFVFHGFRILAASSPARGCSGSPQRTSTNSCTA
jgi:hypothetical protein